MKGVPKFETEHFFYMNDDRFGCDAYVYVSAEIITCFSEFFSFFGKIDVNILFFVNDFCVSAIFFVSKFSYGNSVYIRFLFLKLFY